MEGHLSANLWPRGKDWIERPKQIGCRPSRKLILHTAAAPSRSVAKLQCSRGSSGGRHAVPKQQHTFPLLPIPVCRGALLNVAVVEALDELEGPPGARLGIPSTADTALQQPWVSGVQGGDEPETKMALHQCAR